MFELYKAGRLTQQEALRFADSYTDLALHFRLTENSVSGDAYLTLDDDVNRPRTPN